MHVFVRIYARVCVHIYACVCANARARMQYACKHGSQLHFVVSLTMGTDAADQMWQLAAL